MATPPDASNLMRTPPSPPDYGLDQGYPESGDPEKLHQLLVDLENILNDVVAYPRPLIPGRHHQRLKASWENTSVLRKTLREWVLDRDAYHQLASVGLRGRQLEYKVELFNHARDELLDHGLPREGFGKSQPWYKRLFQLVRPVLKVGGLVVGSLVEASGFGEALKELIEAVDAGMDLSEITLDKLREGDAS